MIEGHIDELHQALISISVIGIRDEVVLDAVVDTGFNGEVCLPVPVAIQLGLELWGSEEFELADGTSIEELVFRGNVLFGGEEREVAIHKTKSLVSEANILTNASQTLIGMELLQTQNVLHIDFRERTITIDNY